MLRWLFAYPNLEDSLIDIIVEQNQSLLRIKIPRLYHCINESCRKHINLYSLQEALFIEYKCKDCSKELEYS